ncbi:MAG: molybdopterin-dependent oxidoreductase [Rhodospirillales bacterium]|nr:molybdopterin-dependent oxidoreductase [Rhodospirillales bacterium]MBO6788469.1 molybdopterin-dependent oxidoreductase [Rhodospirillales bacterium]
MDGTQFTSRTRTTCPYCGVGCGIIATRHGDGLVNIEGDPNHPANYGRLCSKGSALAETMFLDDRLLHPEIDGARVSWDTALDRVAGTFTETIRKYGPDSVAFYVSGQFLTEDYYVANKLMKGFIGTANIDTNSRLCMASSVAGHNRAFGEDVVPASYEDLELADLVVLVGSNLAWCHPVLFQRIMAEKERRPGMRLVVIDPRRTVTAGAADLHLPIAPDGDAALFNGLLRHLDETGNLDRDYIAAHTAGFDAALSAAQASDLAGLPASTGLDRADIETFFSWAGDTQKLVTIYSQGVNQSSCGTDKVNAIINVHLATGRLGRPGMGPFSVTGQPNAMGGREVGGLANQLAAHMRIEDAADRETVQSFWKSPVIADKPGLKAVDLFDAIAAGRIKAIWIMATNPVDSLPRSWAVEDALKNCPFVVVSDNVRHTDTARHAHVLLPATAWSEKDGTVTNSERRISRQRSFMPAPGDARHDWWALKEVAHRMGWGEAFDFTSPSEIYREHAALSGFRNDGKRAFDISWHARIGDIAYEQMKPVQWPLRDKAADAIRSGQDGAPFVAGRLNHFVAVAPPGRPATGTGLVLNTGRIRDHWHTMTRTGKSATLSAHYAEPFIALHPADAAGAGITEAGLVRVSGGGEEIVLRALVTDRQRPGNCFVPMHWTDQYASGGRVGRVLDCSVDPFSGQPALKNGHVAVAPFKGAWYGFAVLAARPERIDAGYWAVARTAAGWRIEMAGDAGTPDWQTFAESLFGEPRKEAGWTAYEDHASGQFRYAYVSAGRLIGAVYFSPSPVGVSRSWAAAQLGQEVLGTSMLAGRGGLDQPDPGPTVCACFSIGANQIRAAQKEHGCRSVEDIGACLGAGTNCGSCKSEIRALIEEWPTREAAE